MTFQSCLIKMPDMKKITSVLFAFLMTLVFSASVFSQNKFEGYNIILSVPDEHQTATCALRYAAPTTKITITDLAASTPMKVSGCGGSEMNLTQTSSTTATVLASPTNYKWCFQGEDKRYRITFDGDQHSGRVTYDWIATPDKQNLGFYNIRDFGAVGDGRTDDTIAIKSAMAFIATRNGGTLIFPEGNYIVTSPIALTSGIVIQGTNGLETGASTNNLVKESASRITLVGANRALFRIGECTDKVTIKDIELYANSDENTYAIEGVGAYISSQDFYFERVVFNKFYRGVYVHGLPQTNLRWQFDYVKFNHCRFIYNRDAGIYTNILNSDWKIAGSLFINPRRQTGQNANSMHFERVGAVLIEDTFGGGFPHAPGGTFINILDSGPLTLINSSTEAVTNSFVYNEVQNPLAGDYSYPVTFINNVLVLPIIFKARRTFVSTGNLYGEQTFQADERVRVYSTGDRFCYDGNIIGCKDGTGKAFGNASLLFVTGQPAEGTVKGFPTYFGTDVQFGAPVQMPSFQVNALPNGKPNGSMVYCTNCKRSTTPCQSGGSGAPAMVVNGQWSCL